VIRFFTTLIICGFCLAKLHASERWVTLENCVYIADPSNDSDSFHVKAADKEYIFRLYFVDAPEINAVNPPRLVEQAKYFGITVPQTIELGRTADSYLRDRLSKPFTVITRFAHSPSRGKVERFYAFVHTEDGDLGEQLVANGLARIFGTPATPPGLVSSAAEGAKLKRLENEAKEKQTGGWSTKREQLIVRDEKSQENNPSKSLSSDSQKEDIKPATESSTLHKLDVNHATRKQLEELPGIGPVLAEHIIAARPLKSADDLLHVDGIGRKKYAAIRPYFD
jgi:DNA uptake protein ComE-like DNA-binding protein